MRRHQQPNQGASQTKQFNKSKNIRKAYQSAAGLSNTMPAHIFSPKGKQSLQVQKIPSDS